MPRRPRVLIEDGLYHVYNRVASGEPVFASTDEAAAFADLIREVKARDSWAVLAWCLMSNHFHLAVRTGIVPLSRGMHHLQCTFSRRFNRRAHRTGSLWQSRYQAKLVDEQRYLTELVLYIHLNPARAGAVTDPATHRFNGHREIVRRSAQPLVDVDATLRCFGDSLRGARRAYLAAVRERCALIDPAAGGMADEFRALTWRDRELESDVAEDAEAGDLAASWRERPNLDAERFLEEASRLLGVGVARLASRARDRSTAEARRLVVTLGVERWGQRGVALAAVLGKNPDVVSWWVGEGVRRRLEDPGFAGRLDELDGGLHRTVARDAAGGRRPTRPGPQP